MGMDVPLLHREMVDFAAIQPVDQHLLFLAVVRMGHGGVIAGVLGQRHRHARDTFVRRVDDARLATPALHPRDAHRRVREDEAVEGLLPRHFLLRLLQRGDVDHRGHRLLPARRRVDEHPARECGPDYFAIRMHVALFDEKLVDLAGAELLHQQLLPGVVLGMRGARKGPRQLRLLRRHSGDAHVLGVDDVGGDVLGQVPGYANRCLLENEAEERLPPRQLLLRLLQLGRVDGNTDQVPLSRLGGGDRHPFVQPEGLVALDQPEFLFVAWRAAAHRPQAARIHCSLLRHDESTVQRLRLNPAYALMNDAGLAVEKPLLQAGRGNLELPVELAVNLGHVGLPQHAVWPGQNLPQLRLALLPLHLSRD